MRLSTRSDDAEWMDDRSVPLELMERTLAEVDRINARLGGFATTLSLLGSRLARRRKARILDVGGGGGGTARFLLDWARPRGIELEFTIVDLHPVVCRAARRATAAEPAIRVVRGDALRLPFRDGAFDFSHASLFLHHLQSDAIPAALSEMRRVATEGLVANDLERHPVAYHAIRILTAIARTGPLVRHDAPLSVRRGFTARELDALCRRPGWSALGFGRRFPFRWMLWAFADGGTT